MLVSLPLPLLCFVVCILLILFRWETREASTYAAIASIELLYDVCGNSAEPVCLHTVLLLRDGDGRAAIFRASTKAGESGEQVVSAGVTTLGSQCRGGVLYPNNTFPLDSSAGCCTDLGVVVDASALASISSSGWVILFRFDHCEAAFFFFGGVPVMVEEISPDFIVIVEAVLSLVLV